MKFEIAWKMNILDCRAQCTITAPDENKALKTAIYIFDFDIKDLIYIKKVD